MDETILTPTYSDWKIPDLDEASKERLGKLREMMEAMVKRTAGQTYRDQVIREWEITKDPATLLSLIRVLSDRKIRLITCTIARQRWFSIDSKEHRDCILLGEKAADHEVRDITRVNLNTAMRRARVARERLADLPVTEENKVDLATMLLFQTCVRLDIFTLLQISIERARKCNIEDSLLCEIIRDCVGNPFNKIGYILNPKADMQSRDYEVVSIKALELYNNSQPNGQLDSVDMAIMADRLQDIGCENQPILDNLRRECPYCKDLGNFQGSIAYEKGGIYDRGSFDRQTMRVHNYQCVCKGTRLARHWKGNWVIDLLIGKI